MVQDKLGYFYFYIAFTYNADGIRTSKTVDGVKHEYLLNGSQILGERWTIEGVKYTLIYLYDENGSPMGLKYRTNAYAANEYDYFFFEKNLQGDIVAVYNASGTKIGGYIYDAWGVCTTSVTSGNTTLENSIVQSYNPFRYYGYQIPKSVTVIVSYVFRGGRNNCVLENCSVYCSDGTVMFG